MNAVKKIGRPKKIAREEVLSRAMQLFWQKGYEGASVKLLTEAVGVKGPSLYAEFGDKQGLFLETIKCYVDNDACEPLIALENELEINAAVTAFFYSVIQTSTDSSHLGKGCFLVSCVSTVSGQVEGVEALLQTAIDKTEARLTKRFEQAKKRGDLPQNFPIEERVSLLFDLRQGLVFRARAGIDAEVLKRSVNSMVNAVLN